MTGSSYMASGEQPVTGALSTMISSIRCITPTLRGLKKHARPHELRVGARRHR